MTTRVVTVEMDDPIGEILEIFKHAGFSHVLVVAPESGEFVGIVSDRDVYRNVSCFIGSLSEQARDQATLRKKVHHIMTRNLITATEDMTIEQSAELMLNNRISCLPVLSPDQKIRGIVTSKDILRCVFDLPKQKPNPHNPY
ncbi:MAG: CBS domain-containing protein [Clostridia bacterium]|nr:CBS domain-containing protein [Clostridia bacterium]